MKYQSNTSTHLANIKHLIACLLISQALLLLSCAKPQDEPPLPPPPPPPADTTVHVTALAVNPAEFILPENYSWQLKATITPANAANQNVTWTSSDPSVAIVNNSGLVTTLTIGTVTITVTSQDNSSKQATAKIRVLKQYDVYAVGKADAEGYPNIGVIWKNGVKSVFSDGQTIGYEANNIVLSGNDIYVSGTILNGGNWNVASYWKNGQLHVLGDMSANHNTFVKSLLLNNNKVYVAGYGFYNTECPSYCFGRFRGSYWVDNGGTVTHVPLYNSISSTIGHSIAIRDNDIYITGAQANDNFYQWSTLWKNTETNVQVISPQDGYYEATALGWMGENLYIASFGGCANFGCNGQVVLMKNNSSNTIPLTDGSHDANAYCMAISGSTVYVAGYEKNDAGRYVAKYWKVNGSTVTSHTLSDGTKSCLVNAIAVSGEDVYLVGNELSDGGEKKSKCWRAWEGGSSILSLDISDFVVPSGFAVNGVAIR